MYYESDSEIELSLDTKMQCLTMNDILNQNMSGMGGMGTMGTMVTSIDEEEFEADVTDCIINDMHSLSITEIDELIDDLFENNLDIYTVYNDSKTSIKPLDPTEFNTNTTEFYNKYNILRVLGVPNIYCDGEHFDDEDFIYNHFNLSEHLSYLFQNDNTVPELDSSVINFTELEISPQNVYYKIIYIYQFIHYFHTTLNTIPFKKRIKHLPQEFLIWTDNIVSIIRNTINMPNMYTTLCVYQNEYHTILKNMDQYFKDMVYGLNLCVCHLKMILNHNKIRQIHFWDMEEKYIEKFFRILNNLCIIVIYMKHVV